jgi:hypothetical protein
MDVTESIFWQNFLLAVFLVPSVVGIGVSTYYAQKQQRSEKGKPRSTTPVKDK